LRADLQSPAARVLIIASLDSAVAGCGAVRLLNEAEAEIKRMYVVPHARRQGIARALLAALEEEARSLGAVRLVLEAGERQPEALGLYRGASFSVIPLFGEYAGSPLSVCMAMDLS
jgi:GNAT superfamily N-acetyltransferase